MASTFSPSLKLTLMGDGDQAGLWGQTTNTNLGTLVEQAITGVESITMVDANYTLTNFNGITNEARNAVLVVTGTNAAIRDLIPPVQKKLYTIVNNTTGGFAIRVIGVSGTGVSVPNGATCLVYCDGTNFVNGLSGSAGNFSVNGTVTATTGAFTNVSGNGVALTAINASNITSGTLVNARTTASSSNGASTIVLRDSNGSFVGNVVTSSSFSTTNFTITESGGVLQFKYGSTVVMSIDSTGNLISATNITAFGTP
jgi:hypothetical protein